MTGEELKAHRKAKELSRRVLVEVAGIHSDSVKYWEAKVEIDPRGWAPKRMAKALGLGNLETCTRRRARARCGLLFDAYCFQQKHTRSDMPEKFTTSLAVLAAPKHPARVTCGAKTRKGLPCRAKSEPGRKRCKFHGGMSTGPKTAEGKARIAEAQRRRRQAYRSGQSERNLPTNPG